MTTESKCELFTCSNCQQQFDVDAFYFNTKRGRDNFCRKCRQERSALQYRLSLAKTEKTRNYPVITETEDREKRMKMIMDAIATVKESIRRKQDRLRNEEENL